MQVQGPQSDMSHHRADNEPATHCKGRGKPNRSPPLSPVKPPLKSVSCDGDESPSNGLLHIHPQDKPNPGNTFSVRKDDQTTDADDTMELLKEADMQNPKLDVGKEMTCSIPERRCEHKSNTENIRMEVKRDSKNYTVTLLKGVPTPRQIPDTQVSTFLKTDIIKSI